ncbi:hypothetical protein RRG08_010281 [Elysia crispata]|uniref:Uncharacterized protein n=1 Tax=Elysia crispata TaxID=231223 RepID=A0AAE0Z2H6_9GAST|nr:hypothetical protein RRG08_010281 [Elysia crispata]
MESEVVMPRENEWEEGNDECAYKRGGLGPNGSFATQVSGEELVMDVAMEVDADAGLLDLMKCNDVVNAINNSSKRLVRCADDSLAILNQDGGDNADDLNHDLDMCRESFRTSARSDSTLPKAFTNDFRKELMEGVYAACLSTSARDAEYRDMSKKAFCKSLLPGLKSVRDALRQRLAENNVTNLSGEMLATFFEKHVCDNEMCASKAFCGGDETIPNPNVSHPDWFYFPEKNPSKYHVDAVTYITAFLADPVSNRCSACDLYFKVTEGDDPVDLFALPENFAVNTHICSLVGMYKLNPEVNYLTGLLIKTVPSSPSMNAADQFVVYSGDEVYY